MPLLLVGVFARDLWKPDEPRETALAARMARAGSSWSVPSLGGVPFTEKPPLYYWLAALSARAFGPSIRAIRGPNLLWALAGILATGALACAAAGGTHAERRLAGLAAAVAMGTSQLTLQIEVWTATDVAVVAATAASLLALWRGLTGESGREKLAWYALMHLFLGAGVLAKNLFAWVVPGLALLVFVAWERRWRELLRWELWAGASVQAVLVLPWVMAVASRPDGSACLRSFFYDNLLGRFLPLAGSPYAGGHRGWLGKYLTELPVYLLPWTFLACAAVAMAWRESRAAVRGPDSRRERAGWRFAVAVVGPAFFLLSMSTTQRSIYLGPLMPGFTVLLGLWAPRAIARPSRLDRAAVALTWWVFVPVCLLLPAAVFVARRWALHDPTPGMLGAGSVLCLLGALAAAVRRVKSGAAPLPLADLATAAASLVVGGVLALAVASPPMNSAQDLAPVVRELAAKARGHGAVLFEPDETIIAAADYFAHLTPEAADSERELAVRLAASPDAIVLARGGQWHGRRADIDAVAARDGLMEVGRVVQPWGGRTYLLLARRR